MTKRPTFTQLKAKKNWQLHTSSSRRKFKSRSRINPQISRRRPASVGNEHNNLSEKRTIVHDLSQLKGLFQSDSESEQTLEVFDVHQKTKWSVFGLAEIVNIPINMAFGAFMNGAHYVRHYFQETRETIGFLGETLNTGIRNSFQSVESYQRKLVQTTTAAIFPSLSYKRKFEELNGRINDLEREVKKLKTSQTEASCAHCHCCQDTPKPQMSVDQFKVPPPPPPPPLPPPPPPVAPPPPPPLAFLTKKKSNSTQSHVSKSTKNEENKSLVVSLQDIKSVKLRKVPSSTNNVSTKGDKLSSPRQALKEITVNSDKKDLKLNRLPVITMKDLMGVKLKRKTTEIQEVRSSLKKTPENNMMILRRNLRKVSQKCSPGGTPMNKTIHECGIGLTPLITRALRKKFKLANPPSTSPEEPSSPRRKRRTISLSPVQAIPSTWSSSPVLSMR